MRSINLRPRTRNGDQLEDIPVEGYSIPEEGDEAPGVTNQEIVEQISALYESVVSHLRERQAVPERGHTWLMIALGEALLTADDVPGDVVLEVIVRPLAEGENNEFTQPPES
jgi:hypothetical protein